MIGTSLDGRYLILSLVGQGSMSVVYKAEHQLMKRIVAIKMLKSDFSTDEKSLARFQQEAKAVSLLSHKNIVSIHDYGISPEGQPYLVMDYLDGESLADLLARESHLSLQRFFSIFKQVCSGLAHAHKEGVIHRDVKPSNMIVTRDQDGEERVKLVDFGIARLLTDQTTTLGRLTQTGEVFGSPIYMSPEQCTGRQIDGRSDIYSLGCVMYATLTGKTPFAGQTAAEVVMQHLSQMPPSFAAAAPHLRLPQGLESLVFKAMERDPAARFQSMQAVTDALSQALPSSQSDMQTCTVISSSNAAVLSAIAGTLALLILLAVSLSPPVRSKIETSADVLVTGMKLRTLENSRPQSDPELQSTAQHLADLYLTQGRYSDAQIHLSTLQHQLESSREPGAKRQLLDVYSKLTEVYCGLGEKDHAQAIATAAEKLVVALNNQHLNAGDNQQMIEIVKQLLSLDTQAFGSNSLPVGRTLNSLAASYLRDKNYAKAEECAQESMRILDTNERDKLNYLSWSMSTLIDIYCQTGRLEKAEALNIRTLALREQINGPDATATTMVMTSLAEVYIRRQKLERAKELLQESLRRIIRDGDRNIPLIVTNYSRLADIARLEKNFALSESYLDKALAAVREQPDERQSFDLLYHLAQLSALRGNLAKAEDYYKKSLAELVERKEEMSLPYSNVKLDLASLYIQQKKTAQAITLLNEVLAARKSLPNTHPEFIAGPIYHLGWAYAVAGDKTKSDYYYLQAAEEFSKLHSINSRGDVVMMQSLAEKYADEGNLELSEKLYKALISITNDEYYKNMEDFPKCREGYAALLRKSHREAEAAEMERVANQWRQRKK